MTGRGGALPFLLLLVALAAGCTDATDTTTSRASAPSTDSAGPTTSRVPAPLGELPGGLPAPEPGSVEAVCVRANDLIAAGMPEEAIALIDRLRGPTAPTSTAAPAPPAGAPAGSCEQQRLAALERLAYEAATDAPARTPAEDAGKRWTDHLSRWVTPLQGVVLAFLGIVAGFLVLARLLVLLRWTAPDRIPGRERWTALVVGLSTVGLAAWLLTDELARASVPRAGGGAWPADAVGTLVVGVPVGMLGSLAVAIHLASRLRLSVEVRGPDGTVQEPATTHVIALIEELGGSPPAGVEIPRGSDVTALAGVKLDETPGGAVAAALHRILLLVVGVTPWRIVIDEESDDLIGATATRNGRKVGAAVIERRTLDPRADPATATPRIDLHKLAAAFVVAVLARRHAGFEGLHGATDWRSIGLHYSATTDLHRTEAAAVPVLARALDHDPGNRPAAVALRNRLHRDSTDPVVLDGYITWLAQTATELGADRCRSELLQRVLVSYVVAVANRRHLGRVL